MGASRTSRTLLAACALALAAAAHAQGYKPTPIGQCSTFAALRIGPERGSPASPLPHELEEKLAEALAACEQAVAEQPNTARLHGYLARLRALSGDSKGALEAARKGAGLGSPTAQTLLGAMLAQGEGVPRDYAAAREELRRAAKAGHPHAHFNLGVMFANGWGVEADDQDAAASFRQAAAGGDTLAMQLLGQRYDKAQAGQWLKKAAEAMVPEPRNVLRIADPGRAAPDAPALVAWYGEKARGGEPWAQAYLGALHESGQWMAQDYAAAAAWYRRAGEAGNVPAQWRLAKLYNEGRGVPLDRAEAKRWGERWQVQRCEALEQAEPGAHACDRLAADRHDPQKAVDGVDSFCMRHFAQRAVAACTRAVKESPKTARYRAQLARAHAHTGNFELARREAKRAADAGSGFAMVLLGVMSERGLGAPADKAGAQRWYSKAAELGNPRGAAFAGVPVVTAAPSPASRAQAGDPRAQHNLAAQLEREKKYDEAIAWYTRAAEQGFLPSAMNLAQMHEKGIGMKQDSAEAMRRYRKLVAEGNGEARYRLARLAADTGQLDEAVKLHRKGVQDDDYRAMLDLGELYEQGRGVPKDMRQAVSLYERAADRSRWVRFKLGLLYFEGEGIPRDYTKAEQWFRRSAADNHPGARNNLGVMHDRGPGMPADHAAAREHYHAALRGGAAEARGNLESLYAEGRGAPSGAAATEWYRTGAEADVASAQYRLGRMYARGEGVERNEAQAIGWLVRAAEQGHPEARKEAAELLHKMGRHPEAAAMGDERSARIVVEQLANAGHKDAAAELARRLEEGRKAAPAMPAWPQGINRDLGEDQRRTMAVRIAGVAVPQAAAMDAAMANPYDIIRWFPEADGKAAAKK